MSLCYNINVYEGRFPRGARPTSHRTSLICYISEDACKDSCRTRHIFGHCNSYGSKSLINHSASPHTKVIILCYAWNNSSQSTESLSQTLACVLLPQKRHKDSTVVWPSTLSLFTFLSFLFWLSSVLLDHFSFWLPSSSVVILFDFVSQLLEKLHLYLPLSYSFSPPFSKLPARNIMRTVVQNGDKLSWCWHVQVRIPPPEYAITIFISILSKEKKRIHYSLAEQSPQKGGPFKAFTPLKWAAPLENL